MKARLKALSVFSASAGIGTGFQLMYFQTFGNVVLSMVIGSGCAGLLGALLMNNLEGDEDE